MKASAILAATALLAGGATGAEENRWVFAIRYFQSDRDVAEVSNVIVRAAKAGYTGLALVSGRDYTGQWWDAGRPDDRTPEFCAAHAALDSWWVMSPDRQRRVKEVARLCKANGLDLVRLIAPCLVTGQAAGAAAALASRKGLTPRAMPVKEIQRLLLKQGAYLG